MKRTTEEVKEYYKEMRQKWEAAKELAKSDEMQAIRMSIPNGGGSATSFYFALMDMQAAGFDGVPYLNAKTFNLWKASGFRVKKGEKSRVHGLVWLEVEKKEDKEGFVCPKVYHLFHESQVEPIQ